MLERKISVSHGNSKMGRVVSVSLPPVTSCGRALPCFKSCYALKLSRLRPVVKAAWDRNWKIAMTDRDGYFAQIAEAIWSPAKPPGLFRWHVAGDIPDYDYLRRMYHIAARCYETRFLVFTKKADLLGLTVKERRKKPPNLSIVVSMWPGLEVPKKVLRSFPSAWMRDPRDPDPRIPAAAKHCDGGCEKCGLCWGLKPGESISFDKH